MCLPFAFLKVGERYQDISPIDENRLVWRNVGAIMVTPPSLSSAENGRLLCAPKLSISHLSRKRVCPFSSFVTSAREPLQSSSSDRIILLWPMAPVEVDSLCERAVVPTRETEITRRTPGNTQLEY